MKSLAAADAVAAADAGAAAGAVPNETTISEQLRMFDLKRGYNSCFSNNNLVTV